jgi:hypothetical protein
MMMMMMMMHLLMISDGAQDVVQESQATLRIPPTLPPKYVM